MDILHALSGSFKYKKYVFIYPNNLMLMVSILDASMLIQIYNKKPLIFTDKWPKNEIIKQLKCKNYNYLYINNNHILTKFQHNFKQIVF